MTGWPLRTRTRRPKPKPRPFIGVDPAMRSGQPTINNTRLPVEAIVGMLIGERGDVAVVADQYDITRPDVLVACWYAGTYGIQGRPRYRKLLHAWAGQVHGALWSEKYDTIPDPPIGANHG